MKTLLSQIPSSIICYLCLIVSAGSGSPLYGQIDQLKQQLSLPHTEDRMDVFVDLVLQCYYRESPDSVAKYAAMSMDLAKKIDRPSALAKAHYCMGIAAFAAGKPDQSLTTTQLGLENAGLARDSLMLLNIHNLLGNNYYDIGLMEMAMEEYLSAITYAEQLELTHKAAAAYSNMARILFNKQSYTEAKHYYTLAADLGLQAKDTLRAIGILMNKVSVHIRQNELDSAQSLIDWGRQKSTKMDFNNGIIMAKIRQSHLAVVSDRPEQALEITQSMIASAEPTAYSTLYNAWYFRSIALDSLGQYPSAIQAAETALRYANLTRRPPTEAAAHRQLYWVNKQAGQAGEALRHYEFYRTLEDTLLDSGMARKLTAMKHLYQTDKQNHQIRELEDVVNLEKLRSRQSVLLMSSLLVIGLLIGGFLFYRHQQKAIRERQEKQIIEEKLLSLQMNPHFLFNTLTSVQRQLLEDENAETAHLYLTRLSQLTRNILDHSREKRIPIEDELQNLKDYLQLQQLRFKNRLNYQLTIDDDIIDEEGWVPPMLVQPLIENAIEHAGITTQTDGLLQIDFKKEASQLQILIKDNGKGWVSEPRGASAGGHKSVALQIVKDRLSLLSKLSQQVHALKIDTRVGMGTTISLHLPFYEDTDY